MPRRSIDSQNYGDHNLCRLWETPSKKSQRRYARAWIHPLSGDPPIYKALAIPKHPTRPSKFSTMTSNPANLALEDQFLFWHQELEARQEEQARKVAELMYRRTSCGKKTSVCGPSWKPAGPTNRESLLAPFLFPILARAKKPLYRTISTYRQMMNYPPAVPLSHAVHHLQMPRKPT